MNNMEKHSIIWYSIVQLVKFPGLLNELKEYEIQQMKEILRIEKFKILKEVNIAIALKKNHSLKFAPPDQWTNDGSEYIWPYDLTIIEKAEEILSTKDKKSKPRKQKNKVKSFPDYLDFRIPEQQKQAAKSLQIYFNGAQGKKIGCIIQVLESIHKIINYKRNAAKLYRSIRNYYGLNFSDAGANNYNNKEIWNRPEYKKEFSDMSVLIQRAFEFI